MKTLNSVYDAKPAAYDSLRDCGLSERRFQFIAHAIRRHELTAGASILELGAGTGRLLRRLGAELPRYRFVGLEPLRSYVNFAESKTNPPNVGFVVGRAEEASQVLRERFDFFLSNDVLHHVDSLKQTAEEILRIAKPRASWLVIEPNWKNPYVLFGSTQKPGERNFWPASFRKIAQLSGWECRGHGHLFLIPPFIKEPRRWMKRLETKLEWIPMLAGGVYLIFAVSRPREILRGADVVRAARPACRAHQATAGFAAIRGLPRSLG